MIAIDIPGYRRLELVHLVLDYNGTLAVDGVLLDGVADRLRTLAGELAIHVITADTFGAAQTHLAGLPVSVVIAPAHDQDVSKFQLVTGLAADGVVAIGNGRNDRTMVEAAALGIAVMQREGVAIDTLIASDLLCPSILDALDLLLEPRRIIATLRS